MTEEQQAVVKQYREQQALINRYREQQTDVKSKSVPAAKQTGPPFFPRVLFFLGYFFHYGTFFPGVLFGGGGGGSGVFCVVGFFGLVSRLEVRRVSGGGVW